MSCNGDFSDSDDLDISTDMTSLIDVIFMLLLFFIIASNFIRPAMDVTLPESQSADVQTSSGKDVCVITVTREGTILCNNMVVPLENVAALIRENSGRTLNLFVDQASPFMPILTIMDEAKLQQHDKITFTVSRKLRES